MRKIVNMLLCGMIIFSSLSISTRAASLDDIVDANQNQNTQVEQTVTDEQLSVDNTVTTDGSGTDYVTGDEFIESLKETGDLTAKQEVVEKARPAINTIASIIVQGLSYIITGGLTVRIILDLTYIVLPFTRSLLSNGYMGNAQAGAGGAPNQAVGGMGGMSGGMGMGGLSGGMGMGGYGMNRGMGMGGMQQGMQGGMNNQNMSRMGEIQWVSNAALNAAAAESQPGPDGKAVSPFKLYIKDMTVILVITPILLVLALTGALTSLGFLLGDVIANGIRSLGGMF